VYPKSFVCALCILLISAVPSLGYAASFDSYVHKCRALASQGASADGREIGDCYRDGALLGGTEVAEQWYRAAISTGDRRAKISLGKLLLMESNERNKHAEGVTLLEEEVNSEEGADADFFLGLAYFHGLGVTQDIGESLGYFEDSATKGGFVSLVFLHHVHAGGLYGVSVDRTLADGYLGIAGQLLKTKKYTYMGKEHQYSIEGAEGLLRKLRLLNDESR